MTPEEAIKHLMHDDYLRIPHRERIAALINEMVKELAVLRREKGGQQG